MNKKAKKKLTFVNLIMIIVLILFGYTNQDKIIETSEKVFSASTQISKNENFNFNEKEIIYNLKEESNQNLDLVFCPSQDCLNLFIESFKNAKFEIKCAFYELDKEELSRVLLEKSNAGINISLVIEDAYLEEENLEILYDTNIKIFSNLNISTRYMHDKFCIIDDNILITGSTNPTGNGLLKNNNNIIKLESKYLSKNYENEFNQLSSGIYSRKKQSILEYNNLTFKTPNNETYIISSYFCPQDNCKNEVLNILEKAESEILFANFAMTLDDFKDVYINKSRDGIKVLGLVERRNINLRGSDVKELNKTFRIYSDTNKNNMHHKFFIIDEKYVITGSMNPSNNGINNNDENILIIENKNLALKFKNEFESLIK